MEKNFSNAKKREKVYTFTFQLFPRLRNTEISNYKIFPLYNSEFPPFHVFSNVQRNEGNLHVILPNYISHPLQEFAPNARRNNILI